MGMWVLGGLGLVLLLDYGGTASRVPDDRNTFVCISGKCQTKMTVGPASRNMTAFQSVENCRLLCGKSGNLWPLPTISGELGNELAAISPANMKLFVNPSVSLGVEDYLNKIFGIFRDTLIGECGGATVAWSSLPVSIHIRVQDESLVLNRSTSEEYRLQLQKGHGGIEVDISGSTVYGVRHGLETLSQLTGRWQDGGSCNVFLMSEARIRDKPVFGHRGLLLDTARNYIPLPQIRRTLDAMAANKLNVLHWHAVDTHSFPLLLNILPQLAQLGAYSPQEVYSEEDIKALVEYARLRGVRILMEIDSPAHAGNGWQFGEKEGLGNLVVCRNKAPWRSACVQPPCGQMNPANPNLYPVLADLYKGLSQIIPSDDMFHMGGDEVHLGCWNQSQEIVDYMKSQKYPTTTEGFMQLWSEFHQKALQAWDKAVGHSNTKIVLWTSDLTYPFTIADSLDKNRFIIETWTDQYNRIPTELLQLGYEIIFATSDVWYLDHGFWGQTLYHSWKQVYDYRIPQDPKVLGGEAAMWSEYVDGESLDGRLWPRTAALAERLWSSPQTSSKEAEYRLYEMRQRLMRRGIHPDQVVPQWCYLNEGLC